MSILDELAIGSKTESDAAEILHQYTQTQGLTLAHDHTAEAAPATPAPTTAPAAGAPGMTAGGGARAGQQGAGAAPKTTDPALTVPEYEAFHNNNHAVAFFFYRHPALDDNNPQGPFWFSIENDRAFAGTEDNYAVLEGLTPPLVQEMKQRGVIMLVEFENQQPFRCTPCYFSDSL